MKLGFHFANLSVNNERKQIFTPFQNRRKEDIMTKKLTKLILVCLCLVFIAPATFANTNTMQVKKDIVQTALNLGVDPYLALSIAKLESNFNQQKKNPSGAVGIFQLMPRTAKFLGVNPHIASQNIKGALTYYKMMYKKFGSTDLALAAYNAGPGNVRKYGGIPPFKETKRFIYKVKQESQTFKTDPYIQEHVTNHKEEISETL